ncbi:hypothetical protein [Streptomyces sp. NPDC048606]|uniref:hypothetical protein n=1 Tax=Streptomyces sp. NPDC048606 TaxID=3154726 RepID=UPI00344A6D31
MRTYGTKTAGAALAVTLLVAGATGCEGGAKADGGKAGTTASPSATGTGKADGGAAQASPAAYLEKAKRSSADITSVHYTMKGSVAGQEVIGDVTMRLRPSVAMDMTIETGDGDSTGFRMLDGVAYLGTQGAWFKLDVPDRAGSAGGAAGGGVNRSGEVPGDRADGLLAAPDLRMVGDEIVAGEKTKHVSGTVAVEAMKAAPAADPQARARQEALVRQLESQGVKSLVTDMWIDESGRTQQVRTRGEGTAGPLDVTVKFVSYDQAVNITAPPADQLADLSELTRP